jgi:hypothetical protein
MSRLTELDKNSELGSRVEAWHLILATQIGGLRAFRNETAELIAALLNNAEAVQTLYDAGRGMLSNPEWADAHDRLRAALNALRPLCGAEDGEGSNPR